MWQCKLYVSCDTDLICYLASGLGGANLRTRVSIALFVLDKNILHLYYVIKLRLQVLQILLQLLVAADLLGVG